MLRAVLLAALLIGAAWAADVKDAASNEAPASEETRQERGVLHHPVKPHAPVPHHAPKLHGSCCAEARKRADDLDDKVDDLDDKRKDLQRSANRLNDLLLGLQRRQYKDYKTLLQKIKALKDGGTIGTKGDPGAPGEPGDAGTDGPCGDSGADGADGQNAYGANGADGTDGVPGEPGEPGEPGDDGFGCMKQGPQGEDGPAGNPGEAGEKGPTGPPGCDGPVGPTGPKGPPGTDKACTDKIRKERGCPDCTDPNQWVEGTCDNIDEKTCFGFTTLTCGDGVIPNCRCLNETCVPLDCLDDDDWTPVGSCLGATVDNNCIGKQKLECNGNERTIDCHNSTVCDCDAGAYSCHEPTCSCVAAADAAAAAKYAAKNPNSDPGDVVKDARKAAIDSNPAAKAAKEAAKGYEGDTATGAGKRYAAAAAVAQAAVDAAVGAGADALKAANAAVATVANLPSTADTVEKAAWAVSEDAVNAALDCNVAFGAARAAKQDGKPVDKIAEAAKIAAATAPCTNIKCGEEDTIEEVRKRHGCTACTLIAGEEAATCQVEPLVDTPLLGGCCDTISSSMGSCVCKYECTGCHPDACHVI